MTRVDFYILTQENLQAGLPVVCKILDKAYQSAHRTYVHCPNQDTARSLDNMLWTISDTSFIPHSLANHHLTQEPPIQIGYDQPEASDILLNLTPSLPPTWQDYQRIIEVVPQDEPYKQALREHYQIFKTAGATLHTHRIM